MNKIVHDLTIDGDFGGTSRAGILISLGNTFINASEKEPKDEIVLTGDWLERSDKIFMKDYETESNLCDCCGSIIRIRPWDFTKKTKLCSLCEDTMNEIGGEEFLNNVSKVVEMNEQGFVYHKLRSWEFRSEENEQPLDNIFLWD